MSFPLQDLSSSSIREHLDALVELDKTCLEDLGSVYCTFPWDTSNFLYDLPLKWSLSSLATDEKGKAIAFQISSSKVKGTSHLHRLVVSPDHAGKGLGKGLVEDWIQRSRRFDLVNLTTECSTENQAAQKLYASYGLKHSQDDSTTQQYLEERGREAKVEEGTIIEEDGSSYYLFSESLDSL